MQKQKVLIIGFGITGQSSLNYVLNQGGNPTVVEYKKREDFDSSLIADFEKQGATFIFENDDLDPSDFDLIITSPGIKPTQKTFQKAKEMNKLIHNDVTLFIEKWNNFGKVVGVTGSNGKSTIVTLLHKVLIDSGNKAILVGNIGKSPLDYLLQKNEEGTIAVIELSSYQLENFKPEHAVDVAVISNLSSNHLDRYNNKMSEYALAKLKIAHKNKTTLIFDFDDPGNQKYILPQIKNFAKEILPINLTASSRDFLEESISTNQSGDLIYLNSGKQEVLFGDAENRNLIGLHNLYNISFVLGVLIKLKIEINEKVTNSIREFKGLEHRIEKVSEYENVMFINDSKSTSPDATRVALEAVGKNKNIVLIAGGVNKGMTFELILPPIEQHVKAVVLLPGDSGELLEKQIKDLDLGIPIFWVKDMSDAIQKSFEESRAGDSVLLSPTSASFNLYKNFEDRGEKFKEAVYDFIENAKNSKNNI